MNRAGDWWTQALGEANIGRFLLGGGHFGWCAFLCHQAAEKALKGLLDRYLQAGWGHDLVVLVDAVPEAVPVPPEVRDACSRLTKHYIPPRYVDAFPSGAPINKYTRAEADQAIADMEAVLGFVRSHLEPAAS